MTTEHKENNELMVDEPIGSEEHLKLKEVASPAQVAGYGLYYAGTDDHPHYKADDGTDFDLGVVGDITEYVFLPIDWAEDGAAPPEVSGLITSGNGSVRCRKFDDASVEDVVFPWEVPSDIDASAGIEFSVMGIITESSPPSGTDGIVFNMQGYSIGQGDPLGAGFGGEIPSNIVDFDAVGVNLQYDRFKTVLSSGPVVIAALAAGELAMLRVERDTAGAYTYGEDVGVYGILIQYTRTVT